MWRWDEDAGVGARPHVQRRELIVQSVVGERAVALGGERGVREEDEPAEAVVETQENELLAREAAPVEHRHGRCAVEGATAVNSREHRRPRPASRRAHRSRAARGPAGARRRARVAAIAVARGWARARPGAARARRRTPPPTRIGRPDAWRARDGPRGRARAARSAGSRSRRARSRSRAPRSRPPASRQRTAARRSASPGARSRASTHPRARPPPRRASPVPGSCTPACPRPSPVR